MKARRIELRLLTAILLAGLAVFLPACSRRASENERLQKQWNAHCKEAADLLAGVTDVASAKAAEPRLKIVLEEMARLDERLGKSYDPEDVDPSERTRMTKEMARGIGEMQRLTQETLRIGKDPELRAAFGDTWRKIPSVFMLEAAGAIPKSK